MPNQMFQSYEEKCSGPRQVTIRGYAEGADGADLTIRQGGEGVVSIARTGEGLYTVTLRRTFVKLIEWHFGFGADTAADVKGYDCVIDVDGVSLTAPRATIPIAVTDSTFTLADLLVNQFLSFSFTFSESGRAS